MEWLEALGNWIQSFDTVLLRIGDTTVTAGTLIVALLIVAATLLASRMVGGSLRGVAKRRGMQDSGSVAVTARLVHYAILLIGFGIALHTVGIDLTALFAAGAGFGLVIAFAMQNITSNFVSGVILLAERSIKPGDVLEVEGTIVTVKALGVRSTIGRTRNEEDLIIPNSTLVTSTVKNFTLRDSRYRVDVGVGVSYSSDMADVRRCLENAAMSMPWAKREPQVSMEGFGSSSVNFLVSAWTDDPWRLRQLKSELYEAIWDSLQSADITIAFPQVDVHFDPDIQAALSDSARSHD